MFIHLLINMLFPNSYFPVILQFHLDCYLTLIDVGFHSTNPDRVRFGSYEVLPSYSYTFLFDCVIPVTGEGHPGRPPLTPATPTAPEEWDEARTKGELPPT